MATASMTAQGLCGASLQARPRSGFLGGRVAVKPAASRPAARSITRAAASKQEYPAQWIRKEPIVVPLALVGWSVPTYFVSIPGLFGGQPLMKAFLTTIGANLAKFPVGPQLDDPFWGTLVLWHAGLFLAILLGQIGVQGRKQGYW